MAETLANVFLETVGDLVVEETKFLVSVGGDVNKVKGDLESIDALLMKADKERHDSPSLKSCISQLKDVENLLEKYAVEVQSHFKGTFASRVSVTVSTRRMLMRLTSFRGMEKDIEVKDDKRQRIVKIYGMGGLGKTSSLMLEYGKAEVKGMEVDELVNRIQSSSLERKCVIVIDDIWEDDHWEIINKALPMNCVKDYKRVKQVLELSYDALPYNLKPCFLFLACFPEDELISLEKLYLLWMAEGFISHQDRGPNETLRDVAQRYLSELAMRCMVQLHEAEIYTPRDKFDSCGIRDLMHDLCSSKAENETFLKRIDASKYLNDCVLALPPSIGNSVSRLAITREHNAYISSVKGLEEVKDLRSVMLLHKRDYCYESIKLKEKGCKFEGEKLPRKVGELIHLRYLSLKWSNVRKLPKCECSMPYLQTLDLRVYFLNVIRLRNVIWKMKKLKHLFLNEIKVIGGEKLRLDGLDELETLDEIRSETARIADIPKLISLQTLSVKVRDDCDADNMSILLSNKNRQLRETCLEVESCDLSWEKGMEFLSDGLTSPSLMTRTLICQSKSFPQLKELHLSYLSALKEWKVEERAMVKLAFLSIHSCNNLKKVPEGLRSISTLREMVIGQMPIEFTEKVREQAYFPFVKIERSPWDWDRDSSQD
ncbi:probable disease resistance protein RXW24L [Salvia splendens]|uniref:probable disease resistance protein RXW24L n=1 Tax=Salvia splendens TaxID=180675 RepID=UPI001C276CAD|nr:probable disease resistance protein RXW24L [Salvia splendens]